MILHKKKAHHMHPHYTQMLIRLLSAALDYWPVGQRTDTRLSGRGCLAQLDIRKERSSSMNYVEMVFYIRRFRVRRLP